MKTTPRRVYQRTRQHVGPGQSKTFYVPMILWAEFEGYGLISPYGYSPKLQSVAMSSVTEEGEQKP